MITAIEEAIAKGFKNFQETILKFGNEEQKEILKNFEEQIKLKEHVGYFGAFKENYFENKMSEYCLDFCRKFRESGEINKSKQEFEVLF